MAIATPTYADINDADLLAARLYIDTLDDAGKTEVFGSVANAAGQAAQLTRVLKGRGIAVPGKGKGSGVTRNFLTAFVANRPDLTDDADGDDGDTDGDTDGDDS